MISLDKLKERKLVQWGLAYLAGAWLALQLLTLMHQNFDWPPLVIRGATVVLAVGILAALVLAWYHGERGEQRVGTVELLMLTALLVIAGVGVAFLSDRGNAGTAATETRESPTPATPAPVAEQGSIAVLPFADLSAAGDQEYFTDGLTEELLNALAQIPELRVAARTSSFSFKGKNVPVDSIARVLNVRHVLEGSVRKAGDRVRITAQLIDAQTGYHLWSETYDRELADIFAVQDEISRSIVRELELTLGKGREGPLVDRETLVPEAHALVLRGEHATEQSTREGLVRAVRFFRQALALDPEYARAHAGLARAYQYQALSRWIPPAEGYAQAKREAEHALMLDPTLAQAHAALGQITSDHDWDWTAADGHLARALASNPGYARAHSWRAFLLSRLGRMEEAIEAARRAVELDPVSAGVANNLGNVYSYAGQPERALEQYQAALELAPGHPAAMGNLALTYADLGHHSEAIRAAQEAVDAAPGFGFALSALAYAYARAGQRAKAEQALAELEAMPDTSPYDIATICAGLGETNRMFAMLERAVEEHDAFVSFLGVDPVFEPYHGDPRMRRLLDRMRLP